MTTADLRLTSGMARQAELRGRTLAEGKRRIGWKAGFGTSAALAKLRTTAPLVGFLTDATQVRDGGTFSIDGLTDPRLEAEVAVRLRESISPTATAGEVLAAVEAVAPAIEIVDMGLTDDLEQLLAGNIFHRAFLVGPFRDAAPTTFLQTRVTVTVNGDELHADVDPATELGRLEDILCGMARQLPLAEASFNPGDIVITGWVVTPLELKGGEMVNVSFATGDAVSISVKQRS